MASRNRFPRLGDECIYYFRHASSHDELSVGSESRSVPPKIRQRDLTKMAVGDRVTPKRLANLFLSLGFVAIVSLRNLVLRLTGQRNRGTCVVLYYHGVRREHRAQFARQMYILLQRTVPTRTDHSVPLAAGPRHAAVTFDDGNLNVIENALPE